MENPSASESAGPRVWLQRFRAAVIARKRVLAIGSTVFALAAIAFRLARISVGAWTIDDAGITYAAAYELADHGSLAPYVEGTPIESYSNPLVFFIVALLRLCGVFDPVRAHLVIEMLLFASMVTLVWSILRAWTRDVAAVAGAAMFAAVELGTPATWAWYGSGLENVWVSSGLVLLVWLCARSVRGERWSPAWGFVIGLVAITRPEAPVYVAGFFAALAAFARPRDLGLRAQLLRVLPAAAVTVAVYVAFLIWRRTAYGDWWPNTFYVKVADQPPLGRNIREYVFARVFPYAGAALFAASAAGVVIVRELRALGWCIVAMLVVSLVLPITAGADWMGEHRFATPFIAVSHAAYAVCFAWCIANVRRALREGVHRLLPMLALAAALVPVAALMLGRNVVRDRIPLNDITLGLVAHEQGAVRWEHQMRLGLPYPVVLVPDAGGSMLVGGFQLLDTASLADFHLSRIQKYDAAIALRLINQYELEEKRGDLIHFNPNSAAVDQAMLGARYLVNETHLAARRDLIEVPVVDPGARLVLDDPELKIYLSPDTVQRAAPGALVRCELIVAWAGSPPPPTTLLRITIDGDGDQVSLAPYQANSATGSERRGMLVGAPAKPGRYPITIALERAGKPALRATLFELEVSRDASDLEAVAAELVRGVPAEQAARRIAWLREQQVPRFNMQRLHEVMRAMKRGHMTSSKVGLNIHRMRWNARLAAFESLPAAIRAAEHAVEQARFASCPAGSAEPDSLATRVVCLGRAVDELRRLGYLGVLSRAPAIARELAAARAELDRAPLAARYRMLVGLSLSDASDLDLQRRLLDARRAVALAGEFPTL